MHILKQYFYDERGATMVEYSLIAALITVVATGALYTFSGTMDDMYVRIAQTISDAVN